MNTEPDMRELWAGHKMPKIACDIQNPKWQDMRDPPWFAVRDGRVIVRRLTIGKFYNVNHDTYVFAFCWRGRVLIEFPMERR